MHLTYESVKDKEILLIKNNKWISDEKHARVEYKDKICIKPWGYEFLIYESYRIGIWFLKIHEGQQTSLHTHFHKDTLLFCLSGSAKINLIDGEQKELNVLESIYLPKYKFHGIGSFSPETYLIEIEIFDNYTHFTDKNDLLRIDDSYKRNNTGYESSVNTVSSSIDAYDHYMLEPGFSKNIKGVDLKVWNLTTLNTGHLKKYTYNVILKGNVSFDGLVLKEGSILTDQPIRSIDPDTLILSMHRIDYKEDAKIIYSPEQLKIRCQSYKDKKIVLTSGCFDILHVGHLHTLKQAKSLGDVLMVCLSNDEQIKKLKGESRPINNYQDRIDLFKTIPYVNSIILYSESNIEREETLGSIMKIVDPDVWVKGSDYTPDAIYEKHPYLKKIEILQNVENKSTTNIINKINKESK
jgi:rfaE bifunctional protein nucleotidyltransferase chain/domain